MKAIENPILFKNPEQVEVIYDISDLLFSSSESGKVSLNFLEKIHGILKKELKVNEEDTTH